MTVKKTSEKKSKVHPYDQVVYFLQGGGALGSYQVGVCTGLLEYGCEPNWVAGTSIGAIHSAIIVGNEPKQRIEKLKKFWDIIATPVSFGPAVTHNELLRKWQNFWSAQWTVCFGQPGFFKPRWINPWFCFQTSPDKISYYDTSELRSTLECLVDFDRINHGKVRLSLGAVEVESGQLVYFDNTRQLIGPEHVMASGALPPGFPAVEVDGKMYWDGGISSNTPLALLLEEKIPRKLLCFSLQLFDSLGLVPASMPDILKRRKDIEFSSRYRRVLHYFSMMHKFRHAIGQLSEKVPQNMDDPKLKKLIKLGNTPSLNIIRFYYKNKPTDLWSKDYEFSSLSIAEHFQAGYSDVQKALINPSWLNLIPDNVGALMHDF